MAGEKTSSQWTKKQVLKRLRMKARAGRSVSAHVFLRDDVDDVSAAVEGIVSKARKAAGEAFVKVGKVHQLAKSFSIQADPEAVAAIADQPNVKGILPSEVDDVYPKPVRRKTV
jgi:hypothetical protein